MNKLLFSLKTPYKLAVIATLLLLMGRPALAQEPVVTDEPPGESVGVHVVQRGETLFRIAQTYGASVESLQLANNIVDPTLIEVGQRLIIPGGTGASAPLGSMVAGPADTLKTLAVRYGTSETMLATANAVTNPDLLFTGQTLDLVSDLSGVPALPNGGVYRVQAGDTLGKVAAGAGQGVTAAELLRANRLTSPAQLYPGQMLFLSGGDAPLTALENPWSTVTIHPLPAQQGRTIALSVETSVPGALSGRFLSRDLTFAAEGQTHHALIGIHAFTRPGVYPLALTFTDEAGNTHEFRRGVLVDEGSYSSETINIPSGLEGLLDEVLLDGEYALVSDLMSGFSPERFWDGLFLLPSGGDVASAFGTRREYSGVGTLVTGRFHSGADFAMPVATPIVAPAPGVVLFAGPLEVRGNTTVIDHGWGVYTGYWHQSGILVQAGELVETGQQIGSIGKTGLVTGAHLHWELWVSGVQVDPLQWVREVMP